MLFAIDSWPLIGRIIMVLGLLVILSEMYATSQQKLVMSCSEIPVKISNDILHNFTKYKSDFRSPDTDKKTIIQLIHFETLLYHKKIPVRQNASFAAIPTYRGFEVK